MSLLKQTVKAARYEIYVKIIQESEEYDEQVAKEGKSKQGSYASKHGVTKSIK